MNYKKIIKKTFWWLALPFLGFSAAYCYLSGINPLKTIMFPLALLLCMPMVSLRISEFDDEIIQGLENDFKKMSDIEFHKAFYELEQMPLGKMRGLYKEAYSKEYFRRFNKSN